MLLKNKIMKGLVVPKFKKKIKIRSTLLTKNQKILLQKILNFSNKTYKTYLVNNKGNFSKKIVFNYYVPYIFSLKKKLNYTLNSQNYKTNFLNKVFFSKKPSGFSLKVNYFTKSLYQNANNKKFLASQNKIDIQFTNFHKNVFYNKKFSQTRSPNLPSSDEASVTFVNKH